MTIFGWIVECYEGDMEKLHSTYEITLFTHALNREVLKALVLILSLNTKIDVEACVVRMTYNIIQALIYYDFATYLLEEIKRNLANINNGEFQHSSYLWWLIMDQYVKYFMDRGLKLIPLIFAYDPTLMDIKVSLMMMRHGNAYISSKHFSYPIQWILTGNILLQLSKDTNNEL